MRGRRLTGLLVVLGGAIALAAPGTALAGTAVGRFADPAGTAADPCTSVDPCDIETAVEGAAVSDAVFANPGTYNLGASELAVNANNLQVHGISGEDGVQPLITSSAQFAVRLNGSGASIENLRIESSGSSNALSMFGQNQSADRMYVKSTGSDACHVHDGTVLRNAVCWTTASGASAVGAGGGGDVTFQAGLRNVTAVGSGTSARGITGTTFTGFDLTINATNTIASGDVVDVQADASADTSTSTTINLDHSSFGPPLVQGATASATAPSAADNQDASLTPPKLVDAATGDFHQKAKSPTRNAGAGTTTELGDGDLDDAPRIQGPAADIGAYEFDEPPLTMITAGPDEVTAERDATFEFESSDEGSTFKCKLDDQKKFKPCSSPKTYEDLKKGKHVFRVKAKDPAGNVGPAAKAVWKIVNP